MSHWQKGKLKMACSVEVLRKALIRIMPQWEAQITVDVDGKLKAHNNWQGDLDGYNLVVKNGSSDLGFKLNKDGTWETAYDAYTLPQHVRNLDGSIIQEISSMKAKAIAKANGFEITQDAKIGEDRVIEMLVPLGFEA